MELPEVVGFEEWQRARNSLLQREKSHTRAADALAAERRRQPMVEIRADYEFEGPDGLVRLGDLFRGQRQLILYHFMLEPGGSPCTGCSMFVDQLPHLAHLHARDTGLALVSPAPQEEIAAVRDRMGWTPPWYTTLDPDFQREREIGGGFKLDVYLRDAERVYLAYETTGRGVESLGTVWSLLDLTPLGRQESWEETPPGRPQGPPYRWWNLHDEYDLLSEGTSL